MEKRAQGVLSAVGGWSRALIVLVIILIIIVAAFTVLKGNFSFFENFRLG